MVYCSKKIRIKESKKITIFLIPHFLLISKWIQFELYRFQSPLLTVSLLISFPAPTKMFQFGAFLIIYSNDQHKMLGCPIRKS